jgi:Ca2+-transporting ATPase
MPHRLGRGNRDASIYSNNRKFVYYLISCNMAEIMMYLHSDHVRQAALPESGRHGQCFPRCCRSNTVAEPGEDGAPALAWAPKKATPTSWSENAPGNEPSSTALLLLGVIVQTVAITATTLIAYAIGLNHPDHRVARKRWRSSPWYSPNCCARFQPRVPKRYRC